MGQKPLHPRPRRHRRCGIALVLVVAVMAIATVMAYAILSSSQMQEQVSVNTIAQANADALGESGVSLAMYYLMHPSSAPVTPPYTQSGITFSSASGSVNLTVGSKTQVSTGTNTIGYSYPITSVATSGGITRTIAATALVDLTYQNPQAISANGNLTLTSGVTLNSSSTAIVCSGTVNTSTGTVNGNVYGTSITGTIDGTKYVESSVATPAPTFSQVRSYGTYTYNGVSCTADTLSATVSSAPTASAANPAHIFISAGNVNVTGTVTMTGTLIVSGNLILGSGVTGIGTVNLTVTPAATDSAGHAFPAVLVSNTFEPLLSNKKATFNGLCLFQNGIKGSAGTPVPAVTINGALLLPSTAFTTYSGTLGVTYNSSNATVPDLTTTITAPSGVKMISWSD